MTMMFVYVTTSGSEEAARIGRAVVEARLAACANIVPGVRSIYWWEGKVEDGAESALILKTTRDRLPTLIARIRDLHSYDCPCIEALPVADGNPAFLEWVARETGTAG